MNYSQSLRYLNSFLNYERMIRVPEHRDWNLARMDFLMRWADRPEKSFFPVVIAGTKGKGSTGFFLESILRSSGIPVGFYSSPHLEDPRERIRINGKTISKKEWAGGVRELCRILNRHSLPKTYGRFTYFEITTLLAMFLFSRKGVRIGIFEVGMGGRFDASNALDAELSILTPVHFDHEAFLGNTLAKIAREKAAIIRQGADVVVSPQASQAAVEIRKQLCRQKARGWFVSKLRGYKIRLAGDFQKINAAAALKTAELLRDKHDFPVSEDGVRRGLACCDWPGRLEFFKGAPDCLLDVAHNPLSVECLVRHLKKNYAGRNRVLVFATSQDKRSDKMLRALGTFFPEAVLTVTGNPRSQELGTLIKHARGNFRRVIPFGDSRRAFAFACRRAGGKGLVVVTGSFYLAGELRKWMRKQKFVRCSRRV